MAASAQRFRRRVLAMLDARVHALDSLYVSNAEPYADRELRAALRATNSIRNRITEMR